ncbi:hypothetical protein AVEN_142727-1 [Araneus ventricosus]|uniref:Uncharacterized protein n=1 Tax=Araneus ventricosus TaxID=182803 RepID=A0A4Y2P4X4_ARAVE|nr:hypothetical protein AVEN_39426-1 [Araneus ventricosus]GBN46161.1 hypothetical protein AVEN_142727-1 [Araneus ventricosus]
MAKTLTRNASSKTDRMMWTLAKNYSLLPHWLLKVLLVFLQVKLNFGHLSLLLTQPYSKIINRLFAEVGFVAGGCFVPPSSETQMRVSFPGGPPRRHFTNHIRVVQKPMHISPEKKIEKIHGF